MSIATLTAGITPDFEQSMTREEFVEHLLDGHDTHAFARIEGMGGHTFGVYPLGNGFNAVAETDHSGALPFYWTDQHRRPVAFFEGEPYSSAYARACIYATRLAASEVEEEEG